jgi:hypothetical protein
VPTHEPNSSEAVYFPLCNTEIVLSSKHIALLAATSIASQMLGKQSLFILQTKKTSKIYFICEMLLTIMAACLSAIIL